MRQFLMIVAALAINGCASIAADYGNGSIVAIKNSPGFLLAAPDRGGMGNDRVRKIFRALEKSYPSQLVFITDEKSAKYVDAALVQLRADGADEIVVLPLFLSCANPKFVLLKDILHDNKQDTPVSYARIFGDSYLATEMLTERLKRVRETDVVVISGTGAKDIQSLEGIHSDIARIIGYARQSVFKGEIKTVVWPVRGAVKYEYLNQQSWGKVRNSKGRVQLLPFHMGRELDSMMSFNASLRYNALENVDVLPVGDDELEWFSRWMQREINRYTALEEGAVGIILNAHGADFHWNETMREATGELAEKYPIEYAFSMADPPSLRNAVRRLEDRGVKAIVTVRVFGMESSFRPAIESLIGWDIESPAAESEHTKYAGGEGGMQMLGGSPVRLKTSSIVATVGGLEDSPLYAEALLGRAREISTNPARETIIIVAHGSGDDHVNEKWMNLLASLASQMKQMGGDDYRDILYQTWREDWPDKSKEHILSVRKMVKAAQEDDGIALIIPARTTGRGPTDELLEGLDYRAGTGFAPHPLFSKWVEQEFLEGLEIIRRSRLQIDHLAQQPKLRD